MTEESCISCATHRSAAESAQQELHSIRRSYDTALDVQRHLAAELEAAQAEAVRRENASRDQLTAAKNQLAEERAEKDRLIIELEAALEKISSFAEPRAVTSPPPVCPPSPVIEESSPPPAPIIQVINSEETARWRATAEALEEQLMAARESETQKRMELAAAAEREAELLQDAALLRAQLQPMPVDSKPDHAEKGNSLFAEVDDKRQEMAQTLLNMKQKNAQLRRQLAAVQTQLATLQKESAAPQQDHHLRQLLDSYEERVTLLEATVEQQRRESTKNSGGLPGIAKAKIDSLTTALLASSAAELAKSSQVHDLRKQLANAVSADLSV